MESSLVDSVARDLGSRRVCTFVGPKAWNQVHRMKRLAVGSMTTPEYSEWRSKRINDNIPKLNLEGVRPMEEYLQVIPSELEIIKQDFEKRNLELEKKIERLEEENMHLRLDVDV
ncbi:hypothetical protein Gotur_027324 [Gossypium turneri]